MAAAAFTPRHTSEMLKQFAFSELIGQGQSGKVWRCHDRATGEPFACKQVSTERLTPTARADLQREITLLIVLQGHRNVLRLCALFEDSSAVYILTELCAPGDLFSLIANSGGGLDERTAAALFRQVASAVQWCHVNRVVHRDIKPENILVTRPSGAVAPRCDAATAPLEVRLADFGLAYQVPDGKAIVGMAGSAPYEAPEVLARSAYGTEADIWSMGVLLFAMLSASWPRFKGGERRLDASADFKNAPWKRRGGECGRGGVSDAAKDLISRMLTVDPARRIDIEGVLQHPWLMMRFRNLTKAKSAEALSDAPVRPCWRPVTSSPAIDDAHDSKQSEPVEAREPCRSNSGESACSGSDDVLGGALSLSSSSSMSISPASSSQSIEWSTLFSGRKERGSIQRKTSSPCITC